MDVNVVCEYNNLIMFLLFLQVKAHQQLTNPLAVSATMLKLIHYLATAHLLASSLERVAKFTKIMRMERGWWNKIPSGNDEVNRRVDKLFTSLRALF